MSIALKALLNEHVKILSQELINDCLSERKQVVHAQRFTSKTSSPPTRTRLLKLKSRQMFNPDFVVEDCGLSWHQTFNWFKISFVIFRFSRFILSFSISINCWKSIYSGWLQNEYFKLYWNLYSISSTLLAVYKTQILATTNRLIKSRTKTVEYMAFIMWKKNT